MQANNRIDYGLQYAALGWPVLPLNWITPNGVCSCGNPGCKSPGKHPLVRAGVNEASTDTETLTKWFTQWPDANIGVATGEQSGLFVLDVDPKNGGNDSADLIIEQHGKIPDDVLACTGSGGAHYVYAYPGKNAGRCTTNLYQGIDTRGDGGYIVVEPSNHISGKEYFWDAEANPLDGAKPQLMPSWLLHKLTQKNQAPAAAPAVTALPIDEIKRIRSALFYLSSDDRDQWRNVGMALHSSGAGDQAFGLWCEWSQMSDKFDLKDQRRVWDSFKQGGRRYAGNSF